MWIFTKHGFFSAVCARQGNGKHGQPVDPDRIMVRARVRSHLEDLKKRFPELLGEREIQESAGTDYAFRLFVQKSAWRQVVAGLGVVAEAGLDRSKAEGVLKSGGGQEAIREADELARRVRVEGVPFFVINGEVTLSGAQPPDAFLDAFKQAVGQA